MKGRIITIVLVINLILALAIPAIRCPGGRPIPVA